LGIEEDYLTAGRVSRDLYLSMDRVDEKSREYIETTSTNTHLHQNFLEAVAVDIGI